MLLHSVILIVFSISYFRVFTVDKNSFPQFRFVSISETLENCLTC